MKCPYCAAHTTRKRARENRTWLPGILLRERVDESSMSDTSTPFNHLEAPTDIVFLVVLWRLRYKLSLRDVAEMFLERGFAFTHETVRDWEKRFAPLLAEQLRTKRQGQKGAILVRG
jgi:putative transposase